MKHDLIRPSETVYLVVLDTPQDLLCAASPEWCVATQQYVHDHAKAPNIARLVVPFLETSDHFWS